MKALIASIFLLYSVVLSAQKRITLLFVGDLMQHQAQIDAARTPDGKYDYSSCFALVKEQISHADIAVLLKNVINEFLSTKNSYSESSTSFNCTENVR